MTMEGRAVSLRKMGKRDMVGGSPRALAAGVPPPPIRCAKSSIEAT